MTDDLGLSSSEWYTDDSMKLLKQEFYSLSEAKRLNLTDPNSHDATHVSGLNSRNCVDGMIVGGNNKFVSWVLSHTLMCHKVSDSAVQYEFLIARYANSNDNKGIGEQFHDTTV